MKRKKEVDLKVKHGQAFFSDLFAEKIYNLRNQLGEKKKTRKQKQTYSHARLIGLRIVCKYSFGFRFAVSLTESLLTDANTINLASAFKVMFFLQKKITFPFLGSIGGPIKLSTPCHDRLL